MRSGGSLTEGDLVRERFSWISISRHVWSQEMIWRAEEWMVVSPSEIAVPAQQSRVSGFSGMGLVHNYMLWKYLEIIVVLELINPGNVTSLLLGLGWETVWSWANMARSEERSAVLYSQPGKMEQPVCCSRLHYTEQDFTPAGWNSGERGPEVCEQEGRDRGNLHRFIYNIYLAYKIFFL